MLYVYFDISKHSIHVWFLEMKIIFVRNNVYLTLDRNLNVKHAFYLILIRNLHFASRNALEIEVTNNFLKTVERFNF